MIRPQIIKKNYSSEFEANILLRKSFKQKFFGIIIDFGSSDQQKLPGSAHFLEHKLFAKEDGDIAHKFEELGADVNAYTSFNETMYYCSGINHTKKLIDLLFELVGKPYFTEKNVNQEKPIIQQELAMYQDEPNWEINNALMIQMFGDTNLGIDVAGTKSSIDEMTKAELIRIYKKKYIAPNMKFIATGDFSDEEIEDIFKQVDKLQSK
ncbi:M16 family metallopeptidase, partial [Lactobacillus agrestimuris]|uniref:M16 family metallopeptidase n=1 Tax=Lactobacillus agrestimuris TaxID=2941328 RepID=UPI002044368F